MPVRSSQRPPRPVTHRRGRSVRGSDRGQATAELAIGLPSLFVVFFLAAWMLGAVAAQTRCADAARIGARLAARGEPDSAVHTMVIQAAPVGSTVTLHRGAGRLEVQVSVHVGGIGVSRLVPGIEVAARAVTPVEATVDLPSDAPTGCPARMVP
ncbi:hypothetical protein ThrDRAFT_01571 [Frankia casuarinae]|nr:MULTISPECIES: TadE family protein [Frankia]ETA02599.1 hypothetical protein CcI6DRAFT_01987 [Frankia sp. CcI6]KFB07112.1 TadE-like protein [Frankia sp. Allo2]EYT92795.1 hypothetical protein ThrDRAFT_01571 [Frankia casuarinae]KDA43247.1 hypothetical protein BMG523Draft_01935 [Frankia sp. BMG5.23]KEZ37966.1 TadE-like protein [Frankia sp. CeD]